MFSDPLTLKYLLLAILAIWGMYMAVAIRGRLPAYLLGVAVFLAIIYFALGSGFSIRIPHVHQKMEVIIYTVHENRVHALAHPVNKPGEPLHIVFSIDPKTQKGAQMRKSFFEAIRKREEQAHKSRIIVDMRGYMTDQGEKKFEIPAGLPPKTLR